MDYERKAAPNNDLDCYKIGGAKQDICDTIEEYLIGKNGGSTYGRGRKPCEPEVERLSGEPGNAKIGIPISQGI